MENFKEVRDKCTECNNEIEWGEGYTCPKCRDKVCNDCICTCFKAEEKNEEEEEEEEITNLDTNKQKKFDILDFSLLGGADLNLQEVGVLLENTSLEYHEVDPKNTIERNRLAKLYIDLAKHYNKVIGSQVIKESI